MTPQFLYVEEVNIKIACSAWLCKKKEKNCDRNRHRLIIRFEELKDEREREIERRRGRAGEREK